MKFRLVLQPTMAALFEIRSGLNDARSGKPPYFWSLATDPTQRADLMKDGWKTVSKLLILAPALDIVYQFMELRFVYPGVAFLFAIVPYLLLRGLVTRLMSKRFHRIP